MKWITRERPKIDRIACPWLVRRFIDPQAEFLYVPPDRVLAEAQRTGAIPYDVPGVELTHEGPLCSFDAFLKKYGLRDPALDQLAEIVRAADTDKNPRTTPDASWEPLRPTPPHPEYPSAHAAGCAASFSILARTFGRDLPFTMETTTAPAGMPTRTFTSFDAAAQECADSRVRLGWHFRYATDAGLDLGRRIAGVVLRHSLRERH